MKVLVLTTEPLPLPGSPTSGAGLRAWSLAFGLRAAGFPDTRIAFTADAARGREVKLSAVPGVAMFERSRMAEFLEEEAPDAIVLQHWGLFNVLPKLKCPLAIDLAGPHLLERQLWGSREPVGDLKEKLTALSKSDFVVCSGRAQRHYFLPFLFQAGFDPRKPICPVIPFSASPDVPAPSPDRDTSAFLYSGYFLPWQDPSKALEWTLDCLEKKDKGRLVVVGGPPPSGDVSGGRYDALLERLDNDERVERHGPMAFGELLGLMGRCGAAIDLMPRNAERELAFPTRTVTMMWAGVPPLHNNYDELAEPIESAKAGWTFDPNDEKEFKRVVERLISHGEDIQRRGEKAQELVRTQYAWDKTIKPLAEWLQDPQKRDGKVSAPVLERLESPAPAETKSPKKKRAREGGVTYSPPPTVAGPNRLSQVLSPIALLLALPIGLVLLILFGLGELARLVLRRK